MSVEQIKAERIQNLIDAMNFKEPKKVPIGTEVQGWAYGYAGVRLKDILDDPVAASKAQTKYADDIQFDYFWGGGSVSGRPMKVLEAMGNQMYEFADDGITIMHNQSRIQFMSAEEYPELMSDRAAFVKKQRRERNKTLQLPREQAYPRVIEALKHMRNHQEAIRLSGEYFFNKKGIIVLTGGPVRYQNPLNDLFDHYRGIRDTLIDLRRRKDVVKKYYDMRIEQIKANIAQLNPADLGKPFPLINTIYHSECFLTPELFDEFYFNDLRDIMMPFLQAGGKLFLKGEGAFLKILNRYRQLPKGSILIELDEDDPFEAHKIIGDWQPIAAGITLDLLQMGTKQQCIDFVKKSFDTFAPGGGYCFLGNKSLLSPKCAKPENIIAVYETANKLAGN